MKIYWVPCGHNSSYSFSPIVLKFFRCFLHGMKICMWFGYNPCFFSLFLLCELVFFWYEVLSKCIDSCGRNSSYSFPPIVLKLCRCFLHEMKMCMWFWYNTLFFLFFCFVNWTLFFSIWNAIKVYSQWVSCGCNSSYSFALIVLKLGRCFLNGMKMCMWFWYNPLIFFFLCLSNFQLLICLSPQIAL